MIRAVEGGDLLGSGLGELAQLTSALPVHLQRLLGGLLSVSELLAQENSNNVGTLVQSMRRVLGVNFPQAHMLELFKNYRNHFAYAYMFTRRLGRTPNAPPQVWEKELAVAPAIDKTTDDSDLIGRNEKVGSRRTVSDADASDQESVSGAPNTDPKWLVSDSEEGEDSEDEELMEHRRKAQQKKRMTRMSASPARRAQPGVLQTSSTLFYVCASHNNLSWVNLHRVSKQGQRRKKYGDRGFILFV